MSETSLPPSIDWPETSSDGPLPQRYTNTLTLEELNEETSFNKQGWSVRFSTVNTAGEELSLWFKGEGESALLRWISCAMITIIPEEGIKEVFPLLKSIFAQRCRAMHGMLPEALPADHGIQDEGCDQRNERPEIIHGFLSTLKSMPVGHSKPTFMYTDEELEAF